MKKSLHKPADTPLKVSIEDSQIVIRMGIDVNSFCALAKHGGPLAENLRINDPLQFAEDTISELIREDEIGASILTDALDKAIEEACNQGSTAIYELKRKEQEL